jgi:hypothetical protein
MNNQRIVTLVRAVLLSAFCLAPRVRAQNTNKCDDAVARTYFQRSKRLRLLVGCNFCPVTGNITVKFITRCVFTTPNDLTPNETGP